MQVEQEKNILVKAFEYFLLQINEEEKAIFKRYKLSNETFMAIRNGDAEIVEVLKKRRGRKKFILIDSNAKDRLSKRDAKFLEKIKKMSIFNEDNK